MPGNFSKVKTVIDGDVITASDRNAEFDNIIAKFEPQYMDDISASAGAMQTQSDPYPAGSESLATSLEGELHRIRYQIAAITGETYWYIDPDKSIANIVTDATAVSVPVGTIVAHYDFNAAVNVGTNWVYCDGTVINDATSVLNGETLPDLSNRYLVGFGTEGNADIESDTWNVDPVGVAGHTINVAHTHTAEHNHQFLEASYVKGALLSLHAWESNGSTTEPWNFDSSVNVAALTTGTNAVTYSPPDSYTKDTNVTTSSSLSATQSIQPRSVRVRWIMRIK